LEKGFKFNVNALGEVFIQRKGSSVFVETKTKSRGANRDYSIIKKWNDFLYEVTGKTAKERKRELTK